MKGGRGPFVVFLMLVAMLALGLVALPGQVSGSSVLWLVWLFGLWAALVALMLAVGGWAIEQMNESEAAMAAWRAAARAPQSPQGGGRSAAAGLEHGREGDGLPPQLARRG